MRPADQDGYYTPYSNGRIQRSDGSEDGDPTDPARKPTDPERKPMDPVRSTTDPARTKRDQGLGLGIVPVPASGGSRGHRRARRREEVGGKRRERVADAATPTRRERRARRERSGRDGATGESRERRAESEARETESETESLRANELGQRRLRARRERCGL